MRCNSNICNICNKEIQEIQEGYVCSSCAKILSRLERKIEKQEKRDEKKIREIKNRKIATKIKEKRKEGKITLEMLAKKVNISKQALSLFERTGKHISQNKIQELKKIMGEIDE